MIDITFTAKLKFSKGVRREINIIALFCERERIEQGYLKGI
jgi:hypothetical protein